MSNRDYLLKDICDENFRTKLRPTVTNDRSAPMIKVEGETLKNFRAVEEAGLGPADMDQESKSASGPPAPPPPPPSFSLNDIRLPKGDDVGTLVKMKKRTAVDVAGQPDRNALMEQIKGGKFKLKKVGNLFNEELPREIIDQAKKVPEPQPAISDYQVQKCNGDADRPSKTIESVEKVGKIKISPLFQAKIAKDKKLTTSVMDEKPISPIKSVQIVAQLTKMLERDRSPPIRNDRFFEEESNRENDPKFSPVDQEFARSTIMNVLSKKMTSPQNFVSNQRSKFNGDENSENSKTLRSADSFESLSSGSISLNSDVAESIDSKISGVSNGSNSSTSKISALRLNFQQNGDPTFVVQRNFGDSKFSQSKVTPKNENAPSKFGSTLSRMKSLELLPTNNGCPKLKIYNDTLVNERKEKSLSPMSHKIYDPNPIPFPKVGTLKNRFEYSSTSTLPDLPSPKIFGPKTILSPNSQIPNQDFSSNFSRQSSKSSNNDENLYTATPIFVNLSKKSPLAKNLSPDSGHSSPKNGRSTIETWRVKKDALENNLFTGSDQLVNVQRFGVSKTLENLYQIKKKRTMEIENVEIPLQQQNNRPKNHQDEEISAIMKKPLNELKQYQFQIDLFKNGTNDLIRLEKRVSD